MNTPARAVTAADVFAVSAIALSGFGVAVFTVLWRKCVS